MKELLLIIVSSALVNNVVLSQFMGLCPFLGVSKTTDTAAGMGGAVIFVITLSSFVTSVIYKLILQPLDLTYLQTIVFILIIAALVQFVEMFLQKAMPSLYEALGVYLPLITTNCAVLGVSINNVSYGYNLTFWDAYGWWGGTVKKTHVKADTLKNPSSLLLLGEFSNVGYPDTLNGGFWGHYNYMRGYHNNPGYLRKKGTSPVVFVTGHLEKISVPKFTAVNHDLMPWDFNLDGK